jgi:putative ABC transport system ATP-binding protein
MIQLENVTKVHRRGRTEVHALCGVTCDIPTGSLTFIVGPSGSGKSTLLYLMGALDEPTSGDIRVNGRSLSGLTARDRDTFRREQVGFVFQSFNLLANLDAVDNTIVPFMPRGVSSELRARAVDLLCQVGLRDRLDHRPSELSGGEQQRVAIARALLKEPLLVLADEPTGEVDSQTGAVIFGYLRELQAKRQTTLVVVTHDERYIEPGDRIIRIRDGRIASR